ncbi:MAG: peptide deformylase [Thermoanaerobaculia bacterium]
MAVLPIRKYGDPVLRARAKEIDPSEIAGLSALVDDMVETMYAEPGVGLAANQVGVSKRLAVIDLTVGEEPGSVHVLINPEIIESEGEVLEQEGCLSIPDFVELVSRPERVRMSYLDREGKPQEMWGEGLMARAICHEIDHLNGVMFVDYLRGMKKDRILKKIQKLIKTGDW